MYGTWKEVKRLTLPGGYVAIFNTLFTDARDQMSDSLAPSWIATSQHCISVYDINTIHLCRPLMSVRVGKSIGNTIYKSMKHFTMFASDNHKYLVALLQNLDRLPTLPERVSKEHYSDVRSAFHHGGGNMKIGILVPLGFCHHSTDVSLMAAMLAT